MKAELYAVLAAAFFIICPLSLQARIVSSVQVHGKTAPLDIKELLPRPGGDYTEEMIRKAAADITVLYHQKGYTAFYVRRVVFGKDGSVDFYLVESVVREVRVTGLESGEAVSVAEDLYRQGEVFNEKKLRKNIRKCRRIYGLKKVSVTFERRPDGGLAVIADTEKRRVRFSAGVAGDPVYGATPRAALYTSYGRSFLNLFLLYAPGNESMARGEASVRMGYAACDRTGILSGFSMRRRDDAADRYGYTSYRSQGGSGEAGFYFEREPFLLSFFAGGEYDSLEDYYDEDSVNSLYGGIRLAYSDMPLRIDPADAVSFSGQVLAGRNSMEGGRFIRARFDFSASLRFTRRFSASMKGYSFFTSEQGLFFQEYVFDSRLPGRRDDYLRTPARAAAELSLPCELYSSLLYAGPLLYLGIYDLDDDMRSAVSWGGKLSVSRGGIFFDLAYARDSKRKRDNGVVMFSARGSF